MSGPGNGSTVYWRELNLLIDPIRGDIKEVKDDITELRADIQAWKVLAESRSFLGARGRSTVNGLLIAVPAALVSLIVAFFAH